MGNLIAVMEADDRKRKPDKKEEPPGGSPAKKPVDPVEGQRVVDELQETVTQSQQLKDEVEVIVSEGPGNIYMDLVIQQMHDYNACRDMAGSVVRVISNLDIMPVREIYESLGFYYEEDDDSSSK